MLPAAIATPVQAAAPYRECGPQYDKHVGQHRLAAWGAIGVRSGATCRTGVRLLSPLQKRMKTTMQQGRGWPKTMQVRGYRCRYRGGTSAAEGGDGSADYRCSHNRRFIRIFMVF